MNRFEVEKLDRRIIKALFPVSASELANALLGLGEEGYAVTNASIVPEGTQADPEAKAVWLVLSREVP